MLICLSDSERIVTIKHPVLEAYHQWVVERNVTLHSDIFHHDLHALLLHTSDSKATILLTIHCLHSYLYLAGFIDAAVPAQNESKIFAAASARTSSEQSWSDIIQLVEKVRKHDCGLAQYEDIRTLRERNNFWNENAGNYISR